MQATTDLHRQLGEVVASGSRRSTRSAIHSALAVLLLTSLHHVYGAIVYATPWRYHAVVVSGVAALVMLAFF